MSRGITLSDIVVAKGIQTGPFGSQLKASEYASAGVPVVMPQNIEGGRIFDRGIARVSEEKATRLSRHRLRAGDVLFARRGDLTKIAVVEQTQEGWLCGTGCLRARLDSSLVDSTFLRQYLGQPSVGSWLVHNAVGQTMLNLSTAVVGQLPVVLPPPPEQQRIAGILATWDSAIEKTERLIAARNTEMAGIAEAAIATSAGRTIRLGDICDLSKGSGLTKSDLSANGAHPCILYGELHTTYGEVVTSVRSRTNVLSQVRSQCGDILIPSSSETSEDLANASALGQSDVLLGGDINILRPKHQGEYDADYLAYYLRHIKRRNIARLTQGNSVVHLYGRDIARLEVTLPELRRQSRIASALAVGRREIAALDRIRDGYLTQRQGVARLLLSTGERALRRRRSEGCQ